MSISSARPDALDDAATGIEARCRSLRNTADAVRAAMAAYADRCPDAPIHLGSSSRVDETTDHSRRLVTDLRRVADAFRNADGGSLIGRDGLTVLTDITLSATFVAHHPDVDRSLVQPSRDLERRGAELGAEVVARGQDEGFERAMSVVADLPRSVISDPSFAAAFIDAIGARRLEPVVEELTMTSIDWRERSGPMADLAGIWAAATRTLDRSPTSRRLDEWILDSLLETASGRNVLRALTAGSDQVPGLTYLDRVIGPLLLDGAERDSSLSNTYRYLLGPGRTGHPDAPMIDAASRVPATAVEVFLGGTRPSVAGIESRTQRLLDMGPAAQFATVNLIRQVLAHHRFDPSTNSRDRTAILRATFSWVVANGPGAVTEPFAQFLAETFDSDIEFYLGRVDTARRGDLTSSLQAVTEHERPWITALLAFERHGIRLVQESLHRGADQRVAALARLSRLEDAFEEAATATDQPRDHARGMFTALSTVSELALTASSMSAVTRVIGRQLVSVGLDAWHRSTIEDPDDHADATRVAREGLRRRIWAVVANDPELGPRIDWSVGGTDGSRVDHLGSRIRSVDDLVALSPTDADLDELAGWANAQPEDLKAIVESYLVGTG